jgi:hypothetical protein
MLRALIIVLSFVIIFREEYKLRLSTSWSCVQCLVVSSYFGPNIYLRILSLNSLIVWRCLSSRIVRHVVSQKVAEISEMFTAFITRTKMEAVNTRATSATFCETARRSIMGDSCPLTGPFENQLKCFFLLIVGAKFNTEI